jgi:hypothetical protein
LIAKEVAQCNFTNNNRLLALFSLHIPFSISAPAHLDQISRPPKLYIDKGSPDAQSYYHVIPFVNFISSPRGLSEDNENGRQHGLFVIKKEPKNSLNNQYCKLVCTGDWVAQLNYLVQKGYEIKEYLFLAESNYRELDDYGKPLKHGGGWHDVKNQCILLQKVD